MRKIFALLAFFLAACESDAAKLQRLQGDLALAELAVYNLEAEISRASGQTAYDSINEVRADAHNALMRLEGQAYLDAYPAHVRENDARQREVDSLLALILEPSDSVSAVLDSLNTERDAALIERDLAQRELNRFMR